MKQYSLSLDENLINRCMKCTNYTLEMIINNALTMYANFSSLNFILSQIGENKEINESLFLYLKKSINMDALECEAQKIGVTPYIYFKNKLIEHGVIDGSVNYKVLIQREKKQGIKGPGHLLNTITALQAKRKRT